jgi:hypothetical protein
LKEKVEQHLSTVPLKQIWVSAVVLLFLLSVFIIQKPILLILLLFISFIAWHSLSIDFQYKDVHLVAFLLFASILLPPITALPGFPDIRVEELFFFLLFPLLLLQKNKKNQDSFLRYFLYALLAFGGAVFVSIYYGKFVLGVPLSLSDHFELLKVFKLFIVVFLISRLNLSQKNIYTLLYVIVFSFLLSAIIGLMQFYGILGFDQITAPFYAAERIYDVHNRMMGTFYNPNTYGTALTIGAIVSLGLLFYEKKTNRRIFLFLTVILLAFSIALTQSRTAVVVVLFAFILITLLNFIRKQFSVKKLLIILIVTTIVLLGITGLLADQILIRFMALGDISEDMSWKMRLLAWYLNLTLFSESILLGWGPAKMIHTTIVDSEYILILRRYGLIGFSFYILLYFIPLLRSYMIQKMGGIKELIGQIVFVSTTVFLIANITNPLFHEIQFMDLWALLLGIFFAVSLNSENNFQREAKEKPFD